MNAQKTYNILSATAIVVLLIVVCVFANEHKKVCDYVDFTYSHR